MFSSQMTKNTLVTGASGFIGSHVVENLVRKDYRVRCLVRKNSNVDYLKRLNVELVYGDLRDKESLKKAVRDVDIVYHLGAVLGGYGTSKELQYDVNVNGTRNILEESFKNNVKKFIHFSTFAVYGYTKPIANEETPQKGLASSYALSKRKGEKAVKEFINKGMDVTIIQPTVIHGERLDFGIKNMFSAIQNGKFRFIGSGNNLLHLGYIDNFIDGLFLASESKKSKGQTYIIGDDGPLSFRIIVEEIAGILNVNIPKLSVPEKIARKAIPAFKILAKLTKNKQPVLTNHRINFMTKNQAGSIEKAKRELGYKPKISSKEGLRRTIEHFRKTGFLK